ncbi:hypothetical protein, partial [Nocardioides sp.]|uniref:hypothetical protein n=1 Tax=Nocardioides sp. TaxID=35761 RepID=UPI002B264B25
MKRHRLSHRLLATSVATVLTLSLAACGSNLNPEDVRGSGGTVGTVAVDGSGVPIEGDTAGGEVGGVDLGDTSGTDTSGGTDSSGGSSGGTSGGTSGGDTSGGDSGGDTSGSESGGSTGGSSGGSSSAGSCDGFKNGPGVTDSTITIGNASDISGPVPGLFETAQDAMKAYVTYYNKANPDGICGRSLVLKTYDSRTDASADQQAYAAGCTDVFAMVGSVSAFDLGGAGT